jgi:hypothetical protein
MRELGNVGGWPVRLYRASIAATSMSTSNHCFTERLCGVLLA